MIGTDRCTISIFICWKRFWIITVSVLLLFFNFTQPTCLSHVFSIIFGRFIRVLYDCSLFMIGIRLIFVIGSICMIVKVIVEVGDGHFLVIVFFINFYTLSQSTITGEILSKFIPIFL